MVASRLALIRYPLRLTLPSHLAEFYRRMDTADSIGVYGEAKAEYTRQLCSFLVPALETYFLDMLADVKANEKDPKRLLWVFQDALKQFPDWNIDKVQRETEKIHTSTKCDYLEEILTAVFIAHTKVLSAIRLTSKQKKLQITIPKLEHFLHRTMSECARLLWSNAYLFAESGPAVERQKNLRQVEQLLHEGVLQSIRGMLPVKSILKEYLSDEMDEPAATEAAEAAAEAVESSKEDIAPVVHEDSLKAAAEELAVLEPVATETETETELDLSGSAPVPAPLLSPPPAPASASASAPSEKPAYPTIIVDTEPPSVSFTHMDAVLDTENPERTMIQMSNQMDNDEDGEITRVEFDESQPAEPLDEFEDLEESQASLVGEDEFETL